MTSRNRKKTKNNNVFETKRAQEFRQDMTGILLIAMAVFILFSNFSSSTGLVGLYLVKKILKSAVGLGIYVLPLFIALYGIILLIRHEVKELALRLAGLFFLFLSFVSFMQFWLPNHFTEESTLLAGGGGVVGYGIKAGLTETIGVAGAYIFISSVAAISLLLVFNVTIMWVLAVIYKFIVTLLYTLWKVVFGGKHEKPEDKPNRKEKPETILEMNEKLEKEKARKTSIPSMIAMLKNIQPPPLPVKEEQLSLEPIKFDSQKYSKYQLPPIDLLSDASAKERQQEARLSETTEFRQKILEEALRNFGVAATVVSSNQGPAVTRFEVQPEPGVKVSKIFSLADDIALNLASGGVRIEGPVPGKSVIGIEVPNTTVTPVRLKKIVSRPEFMQNPSRLFMGLGQDLSGNSVFGDLTKMPHLLIAGTTGSGKSVCINSLIISILLRARPDEVKFIMIDPKMVELSIYDGIPHLLAPVVTQPRKAAATLKQWVMHEMERRYKLFYDNGVRNIAAFNSRMAKNKPEEILPLIVVIIDELADLMMIAANEVESTVCRLAQMARATGIHLVIATQRPSVDVITGLIKANIPSRIAFAVATQIDSRVILDTSGAEKLLGRGDMLYNPIGAMKPIRLQGSFVTDKETEKIINFIKKQAAPDYVEEIMEVKVEEPSSGGSFGGGDGSTPNKDTLFVEAIKILLNSKNVSTSHLQRRLRIGYNRAARLMDEIEEAGIVSAPEGDNKPRRITASPEKLKSLGI